MRVAVTGGRYFGDIELVARTLILLDPRVILVHGDARGADRLARNWWRENGLIDDPHPAEWGAPCREQCKPGHRRWTSQSGRDYCPSAGHYRNQEMVDSGLNLLIAFPGGGGTADMVRRCRAAAVPVKFATWEEVDYMIKT